MQAAAGLGTSLTRFLDVAAPLVYAMCAFMCAVFYILVWPDYEAFSADPLGRRLYQVRCAWVGRAEMSPRAGAVWHAKSEICHSRDSLPC